MFALRSIEDQIGSLFYATPESAGLDVRSRVHITLPPSEVTLVPTGLFIDHVDETCLDQIRQSWNLNSLYRLVPELQVRPRSGLSLKKKLLLLNTPGTIDADYRGEIQIMFWNLQNTPVDIEQGERIAQLICTLCIQMNYPRQTQERGDGGFGSSGQF